MHTIIAIVLVYAIIRAALRALAARNAERAALSRLVNRSGVPLA